MNQILRTPTKPVIRGPRHGLVLLWAIFACALANGCASRSRVRAPDVLLDPEATVDLNATGEENYSHSREALESAVARLKAGQANDINPNRKRYNVLALSGGGSYGAFTAGVLNGWTASGQRPQFDIVSGVSTGALIATYAFLGPQYDHVLCDFYTTTTSQDIYRKRCKAAGLLSDSFVSSEPLRQQIDADITPELLARVAQAHAEGRRLFIGTTNVDTGRLVIWDMGAIASSGKPDALALYRKIVLASASPPGFFPPVPIEVTVNGQTYTELHVDGGTTAQVFFRSSMIPLSPTEYRQGGRPLSGSCIYVIVAGKAFPNPESVERNTLKIAGSSLAALTYAQTRNDLVRIYTLALLTGMDFRMTEIPQDWSIEKESMNFDPVSMKCLYQRGFQLTTGGQAWADVPPVLDASQQSIPRAGTQFLAPLDANTTCNP
jgi:predicted acylesterase/phospholipase RssA